MKAERFMATVEKAGARVFLRIPFDPDQVWGEKERHYVAGMVNGCRFRGLIEAGAGGFILSLGAAWRRDNGVVPGIEVEVELGPEGPQLENIAPDIAAALDAEPEAKAFFESVASFYRKNFIRWIESAKRAQTRTARIEEMLRKLKAGNKYV